MRSYLPILSILDEYQLMMGNEMNKDEIEVSKNDENKSENNLSTQKSVTPRSR